MKKLLCVICGKYRRFEKLKISYSLQKTLVLSIICSKCKNEDEKIFTEKESIEILITGCISISGFVSLLGIAIEITDSAIGLKICAIAAGIEKYKSIIKKKKET